MRVHPRPFGVVLRLGELMSAIPVAFALMPERLQARDQPTGGVSSRSAALNVSMFIFCGVLAQPRRQLAGMANGLVPKASVDQQVDRLASLRKLTDFASGETNH